MSTMNAELAFALKMFSRFFDLVHQPLAVIDEQGKYVYYNQESADLDGYSINQALGHFMLDVYPCMNENQSTMLSSLKTGTEYIDNYQTYYNARSQAVDYQHTTAPLYASDGKMVGVIEIGRDMSGVRHLQQQVVELNQRLYASSGEDKYRIITQDEGMIGLIEKSKKLALNNVSVMIVGETGTGKELFARLLHHSSRRADRPFIALNCAALPATLIESTLFGTVKGAFTGAENSQGYLELADGGTLFLDELNAMSLEIQGKLLRFLQDKTYWKLGGNQQQHSDVRIVAAMNESPTDLIQQKRLRADLFYRLGVGMLAIPPLRSRINDIPLLAGYFIDKYRGEMLHDICGVATAAGHDLQRRLWPGNVRMLENVIVRSMILQEHDGPLSEITYDENWFMADTPLSPCGQPVAAAMATAPPAVIEGSLASRVARFEQQMIVQALNSSNGCTAEAARKLAISRTTLQYKIRKYGMRIGVVKPGD